MRIFLSSIFLLILSWSFQLIGLFLAIKFKEENNMKASKFNFYLLTIGEVLTDISLILLSVSIVDLIF